MVRMFRCLLLISSVLATLVQGRFLQVGEPRPFHGTTNVFGFSADVGSGPQHLRCFDQANQVGRTVDFSNIAVADLSRSPYYFDNMIVSCTFNGIYFLYDNYNFNTQRSAAVYAETWGDNYRVNMNNFGQSLVVTGCNPWTAYEYNNYQGRGVCFYPSDMMACSPGFYRNAQMLGGMANRISSVRKGCYSNIKVYGEKLNSLKSLQESGQEGQVFNV